MSLIFFKMQETNNAWLIINNKDKYCNAPEDSDDDSECNVESNLNDDEMMEDSDINNESDNDNDEEEKVLIILCSTVFNKCL